MRIETYRCDKCKKETEDRKDVFEISLTVQGMYPSVNKKVHLCFDCGKKMGIERQADTESAKTMADKLLDIVYELVGEVVDNGR